MKRRFPSMRTTFQVTIAAGVALIYGACGDSEGAVTVPPLEPGAFDEQGEWFATGGLPEPVSASAAAYWQGYIYMIGGYSGTASGPATRHVLRVDPNTNAIEVLGDFPHPIAEAPAVVYRDTLLVVGGNSLDDLTPNARTTIWWYDAANDAWERWADLPDNRYLHTAQAAGDALVVMGGGGAVSRPPGDSIVIFDGRSASYAAPPNRDFDIPLAGGVIGDTVLAMSSFFSSRVFRYVVPTREWLPPIGNPSRGAATGGVLNGRVHVFATVPRAEHRIWFAEAAEWRSAPPPPTPVLRAAVVAAEGRLFLIGGYDDQRRGLDRVQIYSPP